MLPTPDTIDKYIQKHASRASIQRAKECRVEQDFLEDDSAEYTCLGSSGAHYRITLNGALTNDQAALLRHTLQAFAPARCILAALDYRHAAVRHNGLASRDGTFNRGTA